jgi:hypothetical protein
MSLFSRSIQPAPTVSDDVIERYLARLRADIEPDPLFRRRLRSDSVNRFVAAREGLVSPITAGTSARRMGRVGRACLYASLTLGASAASVLAASQEALPGDALYGLKQQIEQIRMNILPEHLQDELAAYALGERIEEMERLAESGRLGMAIAMAPAIEAEFERLAALGNSHDASAARIERHLLVLQGLLEKLPDTARTAVQNIINGTPGMGQNGGGAQNTGNTGGANASGAGAGVGPVLDPEPQPDRTPRPERTVRPERTPKPAQTNSPEPHTQPVKAPSSD